MKKICYLTVFFLFLASTTSAGTLNLPRTGQTKCWDTAGVEIPCAGTGQDGDIQAGVAWPDPRFTDHGNGTVTDNLTGLMWTKDANLPKGYMNWYNAVDFCNNLNLGGYSDWHLPNVNELESLINADEKNSTWLNAQGFANVQDYYYWTSTSDGSSGCRIISMWMGRVGPDSKTEYNYVWPVRVSAPKVASAPVWKTGQVTTYYSGDDGDLEEGEAWPVPRFMDHGNGTVTDNLTGLMWMKNANLPNDYMNWQQTLNYVAGINTGTYPNYGYTDWRLPNRKELYSLNDFSQYDPSLPVGHPFTNVNGDGYWSSTTRSEYADNAWTVHMDSAHVYYFDKTDESYCVWPVRGGQIGPLGDLDISVTKTDSPDPVTVGSNLTYTITVTNNGPKTGTGVTLTDTLPSSATYVSATSTKGTPTKSGNTVTCSIGKLTNGSSATVTIIVKPTTAGTIRNTASATCNETDTNSGNNTAIATTTVNASPTGCSTWSDVIGKYNAYVDAQAEWDDVITCYTEYTSPK